MQSSRTQPEADGGCQCPASATAAPVAVPRIMRLVGDAEMAPKLLNLLLSAAASCVFVMSSQSVVNSSALYTGSVVSSAAGAVALAYIADRQRSHRRTSAVALAIAGIVLGAIAPLQDPHRVAPVLILAASFAMSAVGPIVDSATLALLRDRRREYGKQRLWGTVGWYGFFAAVAAAANITRRPWVPLTSTFAALAWPTVVALLRTPLFVNATSPKDHVGVFIPVHGIASSAGSGEGSMAEHAASSAPAVAIAQADPDGSELARPAGEKSLAPHASDILTCDGGDGEVPTVSKDARAEVQCAVECDDAAVAAMHSTSWGAHSHSSDTLHSVAFFLAIGFCGALASAALSAANLLIRTPGSLLLTFTIQCMSEVAVLYHAHTLVARLGAPLCVCLTLAAFALRLGYYSCILQVRSLAPFFESLHGVSAGLLWAAAVPHVDSIAPEALKATAQAVLRGVFAVGQVVGVFMVGSAFETVVSTRVIWTRNPTVVPSYPPPEFYIGAAWVAACAFVVYGYLSGGYKLAKAAWEQQLS